MSDDRLIPSSSIVDISGVDPADLFRIAMGLQLPKMFGEMETREIVVEYLPAVREVIHVREPDAMPARPVLVAPIEITFRLEDQMFGGDVYVAITADGHVIGRPTKWESYAAFSKLVLSGNS